MCKETAHAFITLHKDRIAFKVMLPYAKGSFIEGSDPYGSEEIDDRQSFSVQDIYDIKQRHNNEKWGVGQTILRLIRLNGVGSFEVIGGDDLPDAVEYRGGDYGEDVEA